jgi:hypothetical protein
MLPDSIRIFRNTEMKSIILIVITLGFVPVLYAMLFSIPNADVSGETVPAAIEPV